jgi:hypothetical protein
VRVRVDGVFDPRSGEGRDAVNAVLAFVEMGLDVVVRPARLTSGLPQKFTDLLTKNPDGPVDLALAIGPVSLPGFTDDARGTAVWSAHPGSSRADLVLAPDPDSLLALRQTGRWRVEYCPMGFDAKVWPEIERTGGVNVGVVSGFDRVARIWHVADTGESELIPMPSGLTVPERIGYYASVDVLVSLLPSRHAARAATEFMATGGVAALTPVKEHRPLTGPSCLDLSPDGAELTALFAGLPELRPRLDLMGRSGRANVVAEFGWDRVCRRLLDRAMAVV